MLIRIDRAMIRAMNGRRSLFRKGLFFLASCLALTPVPSTLGQSPPLSFRLQPGPGGSLIDISLDLKGREVVFQKEPDFAGPKTVRGALPIGQDKEEFIGFAWDQEARKLCVDLNRNLDLTDDPVMTSEKDVYSQSFKDIQIVLPVGSTNAGYAADLSFYGRDLCSLVVKSGWEGEVQIAEQTWLVRIVDDLDRTLGGENDRMSVSLLPRHAPSGSVDLDYLSEPPPKELFLANHNYEVSYRFEPASAGQPVHPDAGAPVPSGVDLILTMTETWPVMQDLAIQSPGVARLVLKGARTCLFLSPSERVQVPVGSYGPVDIDLESKKPSLVFCASLPSIEILEGEPQILKAGLPFKNAVEARRKGPNLAMDYKLLGQAGEEYRVSGPGARTGIPLTVSSKGRKLLSASFEYG